METMRMSKTLLLNISRLMDIINVWFLSSVGPVIGLVFSGQSETQVTPAAPVRLSQLFSRMDIKNLYFQRTSNIHTLHCHKRLQLRS
jgi:hypothetical protein